MSGDSQPTSLGRRQALKKLVTGAVAALPGGTAVPAARAQAPAPAEPPPPEPRPPTDPNLFGQKPHWKRLLTPEELRTATALCDVILPADDISVSASAAGVPDFIDEWVSAPYPVQVADRETVRGGLAWLNTESVKRFGDPFADLPAANQSTLCDAICHLPDAAPDLAFAARFFAIFRDLTTSGFYTTGHGRQDLGYVGNVPIATFDGPPPEVLRHLGLA